MTAAALALCALGVVGVLAGTVRGLGGDPYGTLWRIGAALWCSPRAHAIAAGACVGLLAAACGALVAGAIVLGAVHACPCGCAP